MNKLNGHSPSAYVVGSSFGRTYDRDYREALIINQGRVVVNQAEWQKHLSSRITERLFFFVLVKDTDYIEEKWHEQVVRLSIQAEVYEQGSNVEYIVSPLKTKASRILRYGQKR